MLKEQTVGGRAAIIVPKQDITDGKYYFYYNKAVIATDTVDITMNVQNPSTHTVQIQEVDGSGIVVDTNYALPGDKTFQKTMSLADHHFFYVMVQNGEANGLKITFDKTYYNYAYFERVSGDNDTSILMSSYTGAPDLPGGYENLVFRPATLNNISYISYTMDDLGQLQISKFEELPSDGYELILDKLIIMGGLPIVNSSYPFGGIVDAKDYSKTTETKEKLVGGTKYWGTIDDGERYYSTLPASSGVYSAPDLNSDYMFSFTLNSRYEVDQEIIVTTGYWETAFLYNELDNSIDPYTNNISLSNNFYIQYYNVHLSAGLNSFIIKNGVFNAPSSRYIKVQIPDFVGTAGTFDNDNDVEQFVQRSMYNDYINEFTLGNGFNINSKNERSDAQVPGAARQSMQDAANTNPTENRVFDVNQLLEALVAKYEDFKSMVKDKIYELLVFTLDLPYPLPDYKEKKLADYVWGLVDEFGFGSVDRIIDWFKTDERKEALAKIILNDDSLKQAFNYDDVNSGNLDYLAVAKVGILLFADYIHSLQFCQYNVMTFLSYYVPSTLVFITTSMSRFQIRIDSSERLIWQQYANQHFRGNLAKMIRSLVTQGILSSELDQQSDVMDEIIDLIYDIKSSSMDTTSQVESFDNDLKIMKSLLSQLVDNQLSKILEHEDSEDPESEEGNEEDVDRKSGGNKFDF